MTARAPNGREDGAALLMVLWMLLLLSLAAAAFLVTRHSDLAVARNVVGSAQARALADAGIARGALALGQTHPSLRWRADGTPYAWDFAGGKVVIQIAAESGKIDINAASEAVLASLFRHAGAGDALSGELVQAILDKRNEAGEAPSDGAFADAATAFVASDALGELPGMRPALLQAVLPLVTVYSGVATIDPDVAQRDVLLALPGADASEVDAFLAGRAGGTAVPLPASIAQYAAHTGTALPAATVRATATTAQGASFTREALVLIRGSGGAPYVVERWAQAVALP